MKVLFANKVNLFLENLKDKDFKSVIFINNFIKKHLEKSDNPFNFANCEKINENRFVWNVKNFKIVAEILNNFNKELKIIYIIDIDIIKG